MWSGRGGRGREVVRGGGVFQVGDWGDERASEQRRERGRCLVQFRKQRNALHGAALAFRCRATSSEFKKHLEYTSSERGMAIRAVKCSAEGGNSRHLNSVSSVRISENVFFSRFLQFLHQGKRNKKKRTSVLAAAMAALPPSLRTNIRSRVLCVGNWSRMRV